MRYSKEHKAEMRERIVDLASRHVRRNGLAGSGIRPLLAEAGLTHGAFYAHFASRSELMAQALRQSFAETFADLGRRCSDAPSGARFRTFVDTYLGEDHLAKIDHGCAAAAIGSEVVREDELVRTAYAAGYRKMAELLAQCLRDDGATGAAASPSGALAIFAAMAGAMQAARALTPDDRELACALLAQARRQALAAVG